MTRFARLYPFYLLVLVAITMLVPRADAQFLLTPQPGDIFREYPYRISHTNDDFRITDPNATFPTALQFLPNHVLSINIGDLQSASRAELVVDLWGGHTGTQNKRFKFNNNAWITIPEHGAGNGIPAGHVGQCYQTQGNPTVNIPLAHLNQGNNSFEGTTGGQTCFNFNWGQACWYEVIVRVYYLPSKPHPTGSITSPTAGSTFGENPTITTTTSADVVQVDFLAYYDGFDNDGDGIGLQYHHAYHRTMNETTVLMKNHVGTDVTSPFSAVWSTDLVPDQAPGLVKLMARLKSSTGVWYMTNEVTSLTLQRSNSSVKLYRTYNIPERFWVRASFTTKTVPFTIPGTDNLANATSAKLLVRTWNGNDVSEAGQFYTKINNYTTPVYGVDHFYSNDVVTIPVNSLVSGNNTFTVFASTVEHGIEQLWPGPAILVRYNVAIANTPPTITLEPVSQAVGVGQAATFVVSATGSATLAYQWRKNNVNIPGATSASYTTPPTVIGDNGSAFRCVVTNGFGADTSNTATLTVGNVAPNVTTHPANQAVIVGATATFSVQATGTAPLSFQWQRNGVDVAGATGSSHTTPSTLLSDNGALYKCIVSNSEGSDTSNNATLTVSETPPPSANVLVNPSFETGTSPWVFYTNGVGTFTSEAPGFDLTKAAKIVLPTSGSNTQLYESGLMLDANTSYTLTFAAYSSGARDLSVSLQRHDAPYTLYGLNNFLANLTNNWQTFSVTFTTIGFAGTVNNGRLRFALNPYALNGDTYYIDNVVLAKTGPAAVPPTITTHPASQAVVEGQTATFSVAATGTLPFTYQWQKNGVDIPGANGSSYTTPPAGILDDGSTYRCRVSNTAGNPFSNNATLTVTPLAAANIIANPGFENGTNSWTFFTDGIGSFSSVVLPGADTPTGNVGKVNIVAQGSNVQLYQSNLALDANTSYTMTFDAFSSSGHDMTLNLQRHDPPYNSYGLNNYLVSLGNGWQSYSLQFTTSGFAGTVTNGRLRLWFAPYDAAGDEYYLDNIVLAKTNAGPIEPTIITHPVNRTVVVGQTAIFSVVASGTPPLSYQWQRDGSPIGGATSATYITPNAVLGDNGAQFRCVVSTTNGSATSNPGVLTVNAATTGNWWNTSWQYRLPVEADALTFARFDKPAEIDINFTPILTGLGTTNPFDDSSIRVIEVNSDGSAILDENVAYQFDRDAAYNASSNALGKLIFIMPGTTPANTTRYYHVYFNAPVSPVGGDSPVLPPQVTYTDNVNYQGQLSYQITTPRATYYYHKQGGGFASMIDMNGNDWISYNTTFGSAGTYRGIPNMGDVFHPGYTNSTSSILSSGDIKLRIRSVSTDNTWEAIWSIYPTYAHMVLLRKNANYWFLYEGTPGGTLNPTTDFMYRSDGQRYVINGSWTADLAAPEWAYFADRNIRRSIFTAHHENDAQPDYYRQMENNMTVFGFGRQDPCCTRYMSAVPQNFTVGFTEDTLYSAVSAAIRSSYEPLEVVAGGAEIQPVPFASTPGISQNVDSETPTEYALFQNYPNPFNPSTNIRFDLPEAGFVTLKLYDVLGREVKTISEGIRNAGRFEVALDAQDLSSGIYIYRLAVNRYTATQRLVLIK